MHYDSATEQTTAAVGGTLHDPARWRCTWSIDKFDGDWTPEQIADGQAPAPYETINGEGNLLMTAGVNALWTALTGGAITAFSNANATIGVGDSTTAESAAHTDLQAASNKLRKAMDATYPTISGNQITFRATFSGSDANFAWQEFAVFNAGSAGIMLNRKVAAQGTKASGSTWTFTVTITIS